MRGTRSQQIKVKESDRAILAQKKKDQCRERKRKQREREKADPAIHENNKRKERERYHLRVASGEIKKASQMTCSELRKQQRQWRKRSQKYVAKKKEAVLNEITPLNLPLKHMKMQKFWNKRYKLKSTENLEEQLKFLGITSPHYKASVQPILTITSNGNDSYTLNIDIGVDTTKLTFKLGEEFQEEIVTGSKTKSTITLEGDRFIHTQIEENGRKQIHVMEFKQEILVTTSTTEGWNGKCVRTYELLK